MTETEDQYYQLPDNSHESIRRMGWALALFFSFLLIIAALVVINAQSIAAAIPFSAEKRFVKPYEKAIRKWYPGSSNKELDHYLQNLADQLASGIGRLKTSKTQEK